MRVLLNATAPSLTVKEPIRARLISDAPRPADNHGDVTQALEHRPEAAAAARQVAGAALRDWQIAAEDVDAVLLVVSELVTNAVEHAQPPLALHLHRAHTGSRVWVGVSDGGTAQHDGAWTTSCADDEHGRGITIISALAEAHGMSTHPGGTTHWARLHAAA
ncbi:ATP-binding protein [Streptomyces sp. NPDC006283]|uniref:ATP-binding protein n=1 Tax=Streptomyces sp. NPDC006283 TaxID=3156741 RepID=UPI0033A118EA